jgi:hypothetical protein
MLRIQSRKKQVGDLIEITPRSWDLFKFALIKIDKWTHQLTFFIALQIRQEHPSSLLQFFYVVSLFCVPL